MNLDSDHLLLRSIDHYEKGTTKELNQMTQWKCQELLHFIWNCTKTVRRWYLNCNFQNKALLKRENIMAVDVMFDGTDSNINC